CEARIISQPERQRPLRSGSSIQSQPVAQRVFAVCAAEVQLGNSTEGQTPGQHEREVQLRRKSANGIGTAQQLFMFSEQATHQRRVRQAENVTVKRSGGVCLFDRQIAHPSGVIEVSLKGKERGEPRRDCHPRVSATGHPLLLTMLQQTGSYFQLTPGSRKP